MRKYLTEYLSRIEGLLKQNAALDYDELIRTHLQKIEFMQHERLVHFLVTMLFALGLFLMMGTFLMAETVLLMPLLFLILILLIPYILHYYFLENAVQKMYRIYDELNHRRLERNRRMREAAEREAIAASVAPASAQQTAPSAKADAPDRRSAADAEAVSPAS